MPADDDDHALWQAYAKDIKPLKHRVRARPPAPTNPKDKNDKKPKMPPAQAPARMDACPSPLPPSTEVDAATFRRIRAGKMPLDGTLDLHGMTQERAFDAFCAFVQRAHAKGHRCLLVITGKGQGGRIKDGVVKPGVLREKLPHWAGMPPLNTLILKLITAAPSHGGTGAWYVYLRRVRNRGQGKEA